MRKQKVSVYQWRALFGLLALIICGVAGYLLFQEAGNIIVWFESFGIWSPVLFTSALSVASMIGGFIAFILGRWLFRNTIHEAIQNDQRMMSIESALEQDGMRISVLVRLSPIIPDEWLNYIMSATPVSLGVFLVSNLSSLIYCLIYAYYGHALGSIALSRSGMADFTQSSGGLLLLLMGIVATVAATVLVTRTSIRILEEAIGDVE